MDDAHELLGLSTLAAKMPRLHTDSQTWRQLGATSSVATVAAQPPATEPRRITPASFARQKYPFDADGIPAIFPTVDARYSSTVAAVDEASLVRMELARRAALSSNRRLSTHASAAKPCLHESSVISRNRQLEYLLAGSATTATTPARAVVPPSPRVLDAGCHQQLQFRDNSHPQLPRGGQYGAPFLLGGASGYPPSGAASRSIVDPTAAFGAASSAEMLVLAQTSEAQAHSGWLEAAQYRILCSSTKEQQQQQRTLLRDELYRERLRQDMLLDREQLYRERLRQDLLDRDELYQKKLRQDMLLDRMAAAAVGLPPSLPVASADGLAVGDTMARLEHPKGEAGRASHLNSQCSQKLSSDHIESSGMNSKNRSQLVEFQGQEVADDTFQEEQSAIEDADDPALSCKTLYLPIDSSFLTDAQCFIRFTCIEMFVSTNEHVCAPGKGARPLRPGQLGFRCTHCKHVPRNRQAKQAVCYPSKLEHIFESIRNFQRVHLNACPHTSEDVKQRYAAVVRRGGGPRRSQKLVRAYYAQAASEVGLVDTLHGLEYRGEGDSSPSFGPTGCRLYSEAMNSILKAAREEEDFFARKKGAPPRSTAARAPEKSILASRGGNNNAVTSEKDRNIKYGKFDSIVSDDTKQVLENARKETAPFVVLEDFSTIPDCIFLLFHQLLPCKSTSATIKRRKLTANQLRRMPGLCCKHCNQKDGINGMYFPLNIDSLGDSSFSQTLMFHLTTCLFMPPEVKAALLELKRLGKEYNSCAKRGWKKNFIQKVWKRMENVSMMDQGVAGVVNEREEEEKIDE